MSEGTMVLRDPTWVRLLGQTPLRVYSRIVFAISRIPAPKFLRGLLWELLGKNFGMNLDEAESPVSQYRSFQDVFVRRLKPGLRPVDQRAEAIISPVDGCVSNAGYAEENQLVQAKGVYYTLDELIGDAQIAEQFRGGAYATLYLRPKDYHRVHCPVKGVLKRVWHIPGTLFPVQPWVVRSVRGLFSRNERMVFLFESVGGAQPTPFIVICVGATGVGHISTPFAEFLTTKTSPDKTLDKGDELATFNLGSTVILLFPKNGVELGVLDTEQEVRVGEPLGTVKQS